MKGRRKEREDKRRHEEEEKGRKWTVNDRARARMLGGI